MTEKLLCPHLLAFRDPTAHDPNAGCYCVGQKCAVWRWMPATGVTLRREGYCGIAALPPESGQAYRTIAKNCELTLVSERERL